MNPMVDWQTAYLQQLQRTTGEVATIKQRGSWYTIDCEGCLLSVYHRKSEIIAMTERLKLRPDWNGRK